MTSSTVGPSRDSQGRGKAVGHGSAVSSEGSRLAAVVAVLVLGRGGAA